MMDSLVDPPPIVRRAPMSMTEILKQLKQLEGNSGRNIFKRAKLATQAIERREWIDTVHGGDEGQAYLYLQSRFFGDYDLENVETLVHVYRHFPRPSMWRRHRWSVKRLLAEIPAPAARRPGVPTRISKTKLNEAEIRIRELEQVNQRLERERPAEQIVSSSAFTPPTAEPVATTGKASSFCVQSPAPVVSEVDRLRRRVAELERENAELRAKLALATR